MNEIEKFLERPNLTMREKMKRSFSLFIRSFKEKLNYTGAVIRGKVLPYNKEYEGASAVSQEVVEENPRRWIIEECVPACKILWDKNIYTFMCSDALDANAWFEIRLSALSPENLEVLENIKKMYTCYQYHYGCINISVKGMGKNAQDELVKIANMFKMQDVYDESAFITMEDLLISCGCYREIPNPKYVSLEEQLQNMTFEDWGKPMETEFILVLDKDKIVKPVTDYIDDYGAIVDGDKIYRSEFHYKKHQHYLNYLKQKGTLKK